MYYITLRTRPKHWKVAFDHAFSLANASKKEKLPEVRLGLYKRFVCLFGDCTLVNTILGMQHLLYCTPPRCILESVLRNIWFSSTPPVFPFNIQYWQWEYRGKAEVRPAFGMDYPPGITALRTRKSPTSTTHSRSPTPPRKRSCPRCIPIIDC